MLGAAKGRAFVTPAGPLLLRGAELGSFTAAAEALGVSQPAVAEQIRKLEQLLGADLFVRAGRGVVPTEAGARSPSTRRAACGRSRTRPAASAS